MPHYRFVIHDGRDDDLGPFKLDDDLDAWAEARRCLSQVIDDQLSPGMCVTLDVLNDRNERVFQLQVTSK